MVKEEQLITVGLEKSVENYAKLAQNAGLDGIVCSGWEANKLREVTGPEFLRVTPGIRLKTDSLGDQKRVMTQIWRRKMAQVRSLLGVRSHKQKTL